MRWYGYPSIGVSKERGILQTVKQIIDDVVDHLPEQATFDDVMHTIYVRQKLESLLGAAGEGQVIPQDEMEKRYLNDAR